MPVLFKLKCIKCKTNYQIASKRDKWVICYDCQKKDMEGKIDDPAMNELFDIPEDFYRASMFLRDIKIKYLKWGQLSEAQVEAFKKAVERLKEESEGST